MADVNRKFVEAAYQDVEATFAAIDKLAGALSLTEAYEVYVGICASRHVRTAGRGRPQYEIVDGPLGV